MATGTRAKWDATRAAKPGAVPWGLLGMLGLMLVCESWLGRQRASFEAPIPSGWREAREAADGPAAHADVLCFGDSLLKKGVLPRVLADRMGRYAYNLAVIGGQPAASDCLLRRALLAGARPQAIIIDGYPGLLASDPRINERQWPELLSVSETIDLAWQAHDAHLLATTLLGRIWPSLKARHEIQAAVLARVRAQPNPAPDEARAARLMHRKNLGAEPASPKPEFAAQDRPLPIKPTDRASRWKCKPANREYLRRFLAQAAERQIPVFWLIPPFSPGCQAWRDQLRLDAPYDALLESLQREFPSLVILDGRRAGYPVTVFADSAHLDRTGAAALSAQVAEILAQSMKPSAPARSLWVQLAPFAGRGESVAIGRRRRN